MRPLATLLASALAIAACHPATAPARRPDEPSPGPAAQARAADDADQLADQVAQLLTGFFDSGAQAAADADYFEIHLAICPVSAPELGARVLYVEQARSDTLGAPYRQRLYVVEPARGPSTGGAVRSRVFELADAATLTGTCHRGDSARRVLPATAAVEKAGCAVTLVRDARPTLGDASTAAATDHPGWTGGTEGNGCPSNLRGASYATSAVSLTDAGLTSWDQGFDAAGAQVWGATKGPYRFARRSAPPALPADGAGGAR